MCTYSQHLSLAETENGQVTLCKGCQNYSLVFKTCLLSFNQREIVHFLEMLEGLTLNDYEYSFFGEEKVVLKNKASSVGVCFNSLEIDELRQLIKQALLIQEAYAVLNS